MKAVKLSRQKREELRRHKQKHGPAKVRRRERRAPLQPVSLEDYGKTAPVPEWFTEELRERFGDGALTFPRKRDEWTDLVTRWTKDRDVREEMDARATERAT